MTTASFVSITCQACGLTSTVPVDALLVSVAVDDHRTTTGLPDADADASVDHAGTVAWTCDSCADLTTGQLDWPALLTLVTAGATAPRRRHRRSPPAAPRAAGRRRAPDATTTCSPCTSCSPPTPGSTRSRPPAT